MDNIGCPGSIFQNKNDVCKVKKIISKQNQILNTNGTWEEKLHPHAHMLKQSKHVSCFYGLTPFAPSSEVGLYGLIISYPFFFSHLSLNQTKFQKLLHHHSPGFKVIVIIILHDICACIVNAQNLLSPCLFVCMGY